MEQLPSPGAQPTSAMPAGESLEQSSLLLQLPPEVVVGMASWLAIRDIGRLSLVCRTLCSLISHDSVWHHAAERELHIPQPLPAHYPSWRSLCSRLHHFRQVPRRAVTRAAVDYTSERPFRPFLIGPALLEDMSDQIAITFWMMLADRREHDDDSIPLVFLHTDREENDQLCLAVPPRSASLIIATRTTDGGWIDKSDDANGDADADNDDDEPAETGWTSKVASKRAFPVLQWTHVTVQLRWPSRNSGQVDVRSIHFDAEDVGNDRPEDLLNPWATRRGQDQYLPSSSIPDTEEFFRSCIQDVRIYDGQLEEEDIAFLSTLVPALPDDMERIEADTMSALRQVSHSGVTCDACERWPVQGLRYNCAENCNFDLCKQCYDAGENPIGLPLSPAHTKDHKFRVKQTSDYYGSYYLVPPPTGLQLEKETENEAEEDEGSSS